MFRSPVPPPPDVFPLLSVAVVVAVGVFSVCPMVLLVVSIALFSLLLFFVAVVVCLSLPLLFSLLLFLLLLSSLQFLSTCFFPLALALPFSFFSVPILFLLLLSPSSALPPVVLDQVGPSPTGPSCKVHDPVLVVVVVYVASFKKKGQLVFVDHVHISEYLTLRNNPTIPAKMTTAVGTQEVAASTVLYTKETEQSSLRSKQQLQQQQE